MASPLSLRRYRPADTDRILELHEEAMRDVGSFIDGAPDPDLEDIEGAYLENGGDFLVGEVDTQIVAMGAFRPAEGYITEFFEDLSDTTAELKRMRVDPAHQRRGHGQRVYDALERRAIEAGYSDIVLDTTPKQTGAQRFYESNSFEEVQRRQVEFCGDEFTMILYRKSFPND
ncbi:GNAT family N-acetyltransferase [Halostagnicola kamekurae]|uniref:Ribosomal protein S18 acetylase RimI n=1 Tax=Halostagnicola kamekurae TaxID=619731 RepID=A0A1I6Q0M3_9EURY|nr:GNAT family N-acetyltransferase [Halostagnicola kamekurae]SFS45983.1 Ribosomal protein S18 acetylase RimI [Halostagnicola kamekurae]